METRALEHNSNRLDNSLHRSGRSARADFESVFSDPLLNFKAVVAG